MPCIVMRHVALCTQALHTLALGTLALRVLAPCTSASTQTHHLSKSISTSCCNDVVEQNILWSAGLQDASCQYEHVRQRQWLAAGHPQISLIHQPRRYNVSIPQSIESEYIVCYLSAQALLNEIARRSILCTLPHTC